MPAPAPAPRWRTLEIEGARFQLMEAGRGDPLLFLHGWGLTPRSYGDALVRLCAAGVRVIAPCLPGSGGSSALPLHAGLGTFAELVGRLVDALDLPRPPFLAGHSFGGGVALRLAHQRPELVRSLTLVNTIGGRPGRTGSLAGGGLDWARWAAGAVSELDPREWLTPAVGPAVLRDFLPNLLLHPLRLLSTGLVAMTASLAEEAGELVASGLPVLYVWGDRDRLTTPGVLAAAAGQLGPEVVKGRHGWMLTQPAEFASVLHDALVVHAMLERQRRGERLPGPHSASGTALRLPPGASLGDLFPPERRHQARWLRPTP